LIYRGRGEAHKHEPNHYPMYGKPYPISRLSSAEVKSVWLQRNLMLFGVPPQLIIVDNLSNVVAETENEWTGLRSIMTEFHHLARSTEACVIVLHHTSEQAEFGRSDFPPPRRAIHGKISQLPSLIVTLAFQASESILRVAAVKNRFGPHSADGSDYVALFVNYATCQIGDADAQGRAYRHSAMGEL
jgi:hypothetical protein